MTKWKYSQFFSYFFGVLMLDVLDVKCKLLHKCHAAIVNG